LLRALSPWVFLAVLLPALPVTGQEEGRSAVTVITRDDILTSGVDTIYDLLRRVPGMDVYDMKTYYPLVGARSMTSILNNRVLVITDGREEIVELTGFTLWGAMSIDLEEIERLEIIRGPNPVLYGANAYSAVINITTVSEEPEDELAVFLSGGERSRLRLFAKGQHSLRLGGGRLFGSLRMAVEGKRSLSDFRDQPLQPRVHAVVRYREDNWLDLSLHAGATGGEGLQYIDMGDLGFYNARTGWVMGKGEFRLGAGARLGGRVYYTYAQSDFHYRSSFYHQGVWAADLPEMHWVSNILDAKVRCDLEMGSDILLIGGVGLRYSFFNMDNIIVSDDDVLRGAAFADLQWSPGDVLQVSGGLRVELVAHTEAVLGPQAAVVYRPWPGQAFRIGYAMGFRKPSDFESQLHPDIQEYNPALPELVERMSTQLGNKGLRNEKVHAVEAGWRARFLEGNLRTSLGAFFNMHQDAVVFIRELPVRMGVPDILNSVLRYENREGSICILGSEAEISWHPGSSWALWANLGLRKTTDVDSGDHPFTEPQLRINFGWRFSPDAGMFVDLAAHYASSFQAPLLDPMDPLADPVNVVLGDSLLVFGRLGYRMTTSAGLRLDAGVSLRFPLGKPFREYAGTRVPASLMNWDIADYGGEILERLLRVYFRGSF